MLEATARWVDSVVWLHTDGHLKVYHASLSLPYRKGREEESTMENKASWIEVRPIWLKEEKRE